MTRKGKPDDAYYVIWERVYAEGGPNVRECTQPLPIGEALSRLHDWRWLDASFDGGELADYWLVPA